MEKPNFKHMCLMYIQQLTNFPYIEKDFDALTDYQLLCKVVAYLNKIITNENQQNETITALYNAFVELKDYVDNLDIQDKVNNKLDEMVADGTLENLLDNKLNLIRIYDNLDDMLDAKSSFVDGMKIRVYGKENINDGGGSLFQISDTASGSYIDLENGLYAIYISNIMDNYYDEITYEKKRYYDTDCYITSIPLNDKYGNQIKPYVAKGNGKTPTEYARDNYTTLTINASSYITDMEDASLSGVPIMIGNGVVLHDNPMISEGVSNDILYLGIKEDRSIQEFRVNNTSLTTLQNNNCLNVFDVYYKLIENGNILNLDNVRIKGSNDIVTIPAPRQCIGIKEDKTLIILTCDGRYADNVGLTSQQTQTILQEYGCYNAWNVDGGGSSSTTLKGSKINRNIDDNGVTDRNIPYTLNFKKITVNEETAKIYSQIGFEKQSIIQQLISNGIVYKNLTNDDLNELIGNPYMGYGNSLINTPFAPSTKAGYFMNIPHSGTANIEFKKLYNTQFYWERDNVNGYTRRQINGVFTPWSKIGVDMNVIYNTGGSIIISTDDYEILPFGVSTNSIIIVGVSESIVSGKYTKFKVNKIGNVKVTVCIDLVPKTASGDRYVRLLKNDTQIESIRQYGTLDEAESIVFQALFNNDSLDNEFSIDFKGKENDAIVRMRTIIET